MSSIGEQLHYKTKDAERRLEEIKAADNIKDIKRRRVWLLAWEEAFDSTFSKAWDTSWDEAWDKAFHKWACNIGAYRIEKSASYTVSRAVAREDACNAARIAARATAQLIAKDVAWDEAWKIIEKVEKDKPGFEELQRQLGGTTE